MNDTITARAHSNIALIKYWGKRAHSNLNLPAVGSISVTLDALFTETSMSIDPTLTADRVTIDKRAAPEDFSRKVCAHLNLLRTMPEWHGTQAFTHVDTRNNFPTAAGLASSASGFAALTLAASHCLDLRSTKENALPSIQHLSQWARMGSGSAARSLLGGFVELHRGEKSDGSDCFAEPLATAAHWPLSMVIAISDARPKPVGSTRGMNLCAETSPYYRPWLENHPADLHEARSAILHKDFDRLSAVVEHSCMKMHACMMATTPALVYFQGPSIDAMHTVVSLRRSGVPVCFTMDAGPQLKALCTTAAADTVRTALSAIPGIRSVIVSALGNEAYITDSPSP